MNTQMKVSCIVLALIICFMELTGLPFVIYPITFHDVDPYIIPLMMNFVLIGILSYFFMKFFYIQYDFGFSKKGLVEGVKKFGLLAIGISIITFLSFLFGLYPLTYIPTGWKVLIEGVLYYIGLGIVEEFYVRGLLTSVLEHSIKKDGILYSIVITSVLFGLGHIPGMLGMPIYIILLKTIMTIGMGLFLGMLYKVTNNLWIPILMHILIDVSALPYCFTLNAGYPLFSLIILTILYTGLGIYSIKMIREIKYDA